MPLHFCQICFVIANLRTIKIVIVSLLLALFAAVEHGHLDKARSILESTDVDVNRWVYLYQ